MKELDIRPSLLAADHSKMKEEIESVAPYCEYVHFDVMDNKFVPNLSFGTEDLKICHDYGINIKYDVHLMIYDAPLYLDEYINNGSSLITLHYEAIDPTTIPELSKKVRDKGVLFGISIKPKTECEVLLPYLEYIDLILIMSVEPGFGGQSFMMNALDKIKYFAELRKEKGYKYQIEVDGGINKETAKLCKDAGVDILVAGTYVFKGEDKKERIDSIK